MAIRGHGSDHASAFRVEKCGLFGCSEITGWIVGHLQLSFNIIKIELLLFDVSFCIGVISTVLRLHSLVVLV